MIRRRFIRTELTPELAALTKAFERALELLKSPPYARAVGTALEDACTALDEARKKQDEGAGATMTNRVRELQIEDMLTRAHFGAWDQEVGVAIADLISAMSGAMPSGSRTVQGHFGPRPNWINWHDIPNGSFAVFGLPSAGCTAGSGTVHGPFTDHLPKNGVPTLKWTLCMGNILASIELIKTLRIQREFMRTQSPPVDYSAEALYGRTLAESTDQEFAGLNQ